MKGDMATVKLKIDGREVEVEKGTNLVDAGKKAGIFMPHFCYHPGLPIVGVCRICLCAIEGRPATRIRSLSASAGKLRG